jgi:hypothetical protein
MLTTGRWGQLERIKGSTEPEQLFQTVPGIGPELASRIHDVLGSVDDEDKLLAGVPLRLETVFELAREVVLLGRKRTTALAGGQGYSKACGARLDDLSSRLASKLVSLRLHPDRLGELLAEIEGERRKLEMIEKELMLLSKRGVAGQDLLLGRELLASESPSSTQQNRLAELRAEMISIALEPVQS